ncbi:MAG: glycosyltransferase family 2 protein [Eubacteriales bacterium]|nr:glycosyltransferase family 2 protein [Eubacteriales bacterium]
MRTLVVIPAYNEGKAIFSVVKTVKGAHENVDVLVVDDGSGDETFSESQRAGAKAVRLPLNLGIGGAVQTGYIYALEHGYDCVVQIDGDGQHDPKDLHKLLSLIENEKCDMAIGSRFVKKTEYTPSFFRKIGIVYFSKLVSFITGQAITDTTSGYRAVNRKVIEQFSKYYPTDYPEVETIVYIAKNGFKIKEVSVDMKQRMAGKSSITPLKSLYYTIKVTICLLFMKKGRRFV